MQNAPCGFVSTSATMTDFHHLAQELM